MYLKYALSGGISFDMTLVGATGLSTIFNVLFFTREAVTGFILRVRNIHNKNSSLHVVCFFVFFTERQLGGKHYCNGIAIITNFSLLSLVGESS